MRKTIQRLKNERGLTLVELLAVIVILAIIAVIAFVFIGGVIENSKKDAHIANAQQVISAAKLHEATGGNADGITATKLQQEDYLDQILNPWTKEEYKGLNDVKVSKQTTGTAPDERTEYSITFKIATDDEGKCDIDNKTEVDLAGDRSDICD